ncbi:ABC transporter permease subunit [Streptomyces sp. NPDC059892]|uniref:ABC transporter permease subunit n=1 Tax=Streptomyces sp. NPDC059892 TaxID=3346989 RepID=UPI00365B56CA
MSRLRVVLDVLLPSTLPFIIAGVRVAVGRALVGAVAVEFLASLPGLGTYILSNAHSFEQDGDGAAPTGPLASARQPLKYRTLKYRTLTYRPLRTDH